MSEETGVHLAACCRILRAPRSTVYARRRPSGGNSIKRGPHTALPDDELLERIREAIRISGRLIASLQTEVCSPDSER